MRLYEYLLFFAALLHKMRRKFKSHGIWNRQITQAQFSSGHITLIVETNMDKMNLYNIGTNSNSLLLFIRST